MEKNINAKSFVTKNGETVIIRPVRKVDAAFIVAKASEIVKEGTFIQKEKVRTIEEERKFIDEMNTKNNMYIVIELDREIIGIARVIRGALEMKRHVGLFRTWLLEKGQGRGIGSKVMEYTLLWSRVNNLHKISLTVFSGNKKAAKLYEKFNFVIEGVQKDQLFINGDFQDEIHMAYFL